MEQLPPLPPPLGQLPQSPGQSLQVSLPLQLPSPHFAAGGEGAGELDPQFPQAEQLLPSPQQSPYCAQEASHQHPLGACFPQCPAHSLLVPGAGCDGGAGQAPQSAGQVLQSSPEPESHWLSPQLAAGGGGAAGGLPTPQSPGALVMAMSAP